MNPNALATLGIGYESSVMARLGIWPVVVDEESTGGGAFAVVNLPSAKQQGKRNKKEREFLAFFSPGRLL